MLQIFLDKTQVDLSQDTSITLVYENPFFTPDGIVAPYTFSWTLPRTARNLATIGYADRVGGRMPTSSRPCRIVFDGVELIAGTTIIETVSSDGIECGFTSGDILSTTSKWLYELDLGRESFGNATEQSVGSSKAWYIAAPFNAYKAYWDARSTELWPSVVAPTMVVADSDWIAPGSVTTSSGVVSQTANRDASRVNNYSKDGYGLNYMRFAKILPSVRLAHIMKAIHPNLGVAFERAYARDFVLCTSYHPSYRRDDNSLVWSFDRNTGEAWLDFKDFMPKINAGDFVVECLKALCASIYIVGDSPVMATRQEVLLASDPIDLTGKVLGEPVVSITMGQKYVLEYSSSAGTDHDASADTAVSSTAGVAAMVRDTGSQNDTSGLNLRTLEIFRTGQLFEMKTSSYLSSESRAHFEYKPVRGNKLMFIQPDEQSEVYSVSIGLSPLPMTVATDMLIDPEMTPQFDGQGRSQHNYIYCPVIEVSTDKRPEKAYVSSWMGRQSTVGYGATFAYPLAASDGRTADGMARKWSSFEIQGSNGLRGSLHSEFADWVERDKQTLEFEALLSATDLKGLDLRRKVHYNGRNMLVRKLSVTIQTISISPSQIETVEC